MSRFLWTLWICLSCLQCSYDDSLQMKSINNEWHYASHQEFDIQTEDTLPKDIYLMIRNNESYPYSNLRLIVHMGKKNHSPIVIDTLNYMLARPDGSWLGRGFGAVKESEFLYKKQFSFPDTGVYQMKITQAMRKDTLKGIEDIGYKIEPSKSSL